MNPTIRPHRFVDILTILTFAVFLVLAMVGAIIHRHDTFSITEKRPLAGRPTLSARTWFANTLQPKIEKYLSDRFGGRTTLVRWNSMVHVKVLHQSPHMIVTVGQGGWLLYAAENALDPYRPDRPQPTQANTWRDRTVAMWDNLAKQGIPFYVLVAPNPPTVVTASLPKGYRSEPITNLAAYRASMLSTDVTVIDPLVDLQAAKTTHAVYRQSDSHWNSFGAMIATNSLMSAMKSKFPTMREWTPEKYRISDLTVPGGDLATALGLSNVLRETEPFIQRLDDRRSHKVGTPDYGLKLQQMPSAYESDNRLLPHAVVFRDSYANMMMPFLTRQFSRVVYIRSRLVIPEVIAAEKPDVVIMEIAERYLPDIGTPSTRESENGITN